MSTTNQLTQQEKQACTILSELFLDVEHTPLEINHISSSLRPLGIPVPKLEHMLRYDLFPILSLNLLSIGGAWQGIDENWLVQQVQARRSSGSGFLRNAVDGIAWHSLSRGISSLWDKVKDRLNEVPNARL